MPGFLEPVRGQIYIVVIHGRFPMAIHGIGENDEPSTEFRSELDNRCRTICGVAAVECMGEIVEVIPQNDTAR